MRIAAPRIGRWAPLGLALALLLAGGGASLASTSAGHALGWNACGAGGAAESTRYHLRGGIVAGGSGARAGGGYRAVLGRWSSLSTPPGVPRTPPPGEGMYLPLVHRDG
jgi:hypothetical protein